MNPPKFRRVGDTYCYTWAEHNVRIELDRFKEHGDSLTVEMTILDLRNETPGLVHSARFNLAAGGTRQSLAKSLAVDELASVPWRQILETLCFDARERYRDGDPLVDLRTVDPYTKPMWFLEPYIENGGPTIMAAPGGAGKSLLALAMAYTVATGQQFVGRPANGPTPVLYLDWETSADVHAERLTALTAGAGARELPAIHYRRMSSSLSEAASTVRRDIDKVNAGMVIVDSLGFAGDGPPEESGTALALFRAIRTFEVPTLAIHHKRKAVGGTDSDRDGVFGSVYFVNSARRLWTVNTAPSEEEDCALLSLANQKANNGRLAKAHALRLRFDNSDEHLMAVTITRAEIADVPELTEKLPMKERVMIALRHGMMTAAELADELSVEAGTLRPVLSRMKAAKKLIQLPDHNWGLAERPG